MYYNLLSIATTYFEYDMISACIARALASAKEASGHAKEGEILAHTDAEYATISSSRLWARLFDKHFSFEHCNGS